MPRTKRPVGRPRKPLPAATTQSHAPVIAVGYIRVSTLDQVAEGTSLDVQQASLADYCRAHRWQLAEVYVENGVSGALNPTSRPELGRLLADLERLGATRLVVTRLDRLARSARHLLNLYDTLEQAGVAVVSISDHLDTSSATGRLMRTLLAGMAEFERESIKERLDSGRTARARQGKYVGGYVAYGYRVLDGHWVIDEPLAKVVRSIFEKRTDGATLQAIADALNASGTPTPGGGLKWRPSSVASILDNPVYLGRPAWGKRRANPAEAEVGLVPAIVDVLPFRFAA